MSAPLPDPALRQPLRGLVTRQASLRMHPLTPSPTKRGRFSLTSIMAPLRGIFKDLSKWRDIPHTQTGALKMVNSEHASNWSKDWAKSWSNPNGFFTEADKLIPRFQRKHKGPRTGKTPWKRRTEHSPSFKHTIKLQWWRMCTHERLDMGQQDRIQNLHTKGQFILTKVQSGSIQERFSFQQMVQDKWTATCKRMKLPPTQCYTPKLSKTGPKSKFNSFKHKASKGKHTRKSLLRWVTWHQKHNLYTEKLLC